MRKTSLILLLVLFALLACAFQPVIASTAQNASAEEAILPEAASAPPQDRAAVSSSPAIQFAVALTGLLFGILTFLPLLFQDNPGNARSGGTD